MYPGHLHRIKQSELSLQKYLQSANKPVTVWFHSKNCSEYDESVEKLTDYVYLLKTAYQSIIKPVDAPSSISGANDPSNVSSSPRMCRLSLCARLFAMRCTSWHEWPFDEDSKSFHKERDLCIKGFQKCSDTTARPRAMLPFTSKNRKYRAYKLDLWSGSTYGRKIKQLTFFADVPFRWSCVMRWVSECEAKVITDYPYRHQHMPPARPFSDHQTMLTINILCFIYIYIL